MRWEFYVQLFVNQLSQAFGNNAFRVMFSEMMPVSNEVRWFGMQVVISRATVSIEQRSMILTQQYPAVATNSFRQANVDGARFGSTMSRTGPCRMPRINSGSR